MGRRRNRIFVQGAVLLAGCGHLLAGPPPPPEDSPAGAVALSNNLHWQDAPLRDALERLSRSQGVAIMLDRRIDPDTKITASLRHPQIAGALRAIAEPRDWHVACLPSVMYVGPRDATRALATWHAVQAEAVQRLSPAIRRRWQQPADGSWPRLAEPHELVDSWLKQAGIQRRGTNKVPHDLWPAQQLPPLNLLQRLVVVLAGFQLAPLVDANGHVQFVDLPTELTLTRTFRLPRQRRNEIPRLRDKLPDAQIRVSGANLTVTSHQEDLDEVAAWLSGRRKPNPVPSADWRDKRFTLTVRNQTIEAVLRAVTGQLNLDLDWHPGTELVRQERINLDAKELTRDELLQAVLQGQGVLYRVEGERLLIVPDGK